MTPERRRQQRARYAARPTSEVAAVRATKYPTGHKVCVQCQQSKPLSAFFNSIWAYDGLYTKCRTCHPPKGTN
jgi:hypothetical protein